MKKSGIDGLREYVFDRLERELSPLLSYHCIAHTRDDVLPAAMRLAQAAKLGDDDIVLLEGAVLLHDLGFIEMRVGHEQVSARIAWEIMPGLGFEAAQIQAIVGIIGATKLPQSPRTKLEKIMCDADLDVLGRTDFFVTNAALRAEMEAYGERMEDSEWYASQLEFLELHAYHTPEASRLRDETKQKNIAQLRERIEGRGR